MTPPRISKVLLLGAATISPLAGQTLEAVSDAYETDEDILLSVDAAAGLLANDNTNGDDDALVGLVTPPGMGEVTLNPDGSFDFLPDANFNGNDSFDYRIFWGATPVSFAIDEANSSMELRAILRVDFNGLPSVSNDSDSSNLSGTVEVRVAPDGGIIPVVQITNFDALFKERIQLEFGVGCLPFIGCLAGLELDFPAESLSMTTTATGEATQVEPNGVFSQAGNFLQLAGDGTITGTGQLADLFPETPLPLLVPPVPTLLNGRIRIEGDDVVLDLPLNFENTVAFDANTSFTFALEGTIRATTPLASIPAPAVSEPATVDLTIRPVNDAPVAGLDVYFVRADTVLEVQADGEVTNETIIARNSNWKYQNNGTDLGVAWRKWEFDDAGWSEGPAELGYGDSSFLGGNRPEATNIRPGGAPVHPTAYFRKEFMVADTNATRSISLEILRDDGAAVFLNGTEVARQNLPPDARFGTFASDSVSFSDETRFYEETVDPSLLLEGRNVLAVEVHQANLTDNFLFPADLSFDFELSRGRGLSGLLVNDQDIDSPGFTASLHTPPSNGTVSVSPDGSFTYTPNPGFIGNDSFIYGLDDGGAGEDAVLLLLPRGSVWKYKDDGSDQGTAWRDPFFNDASWESGPGELGYGDDNTIDSRPETTVIDSGPTGAFHITTYFRTFFDVTAPLPLVKSLTLRLLRDDAAVVYLNGEELIRSNLPADADFETGAILPIEGPFESEYLEFDIPSTALVEGRNFLAVEVHQHANFSNDCSFDLELEAVAEPGGRVSLSVVSEDNDGDQLPDSWERIHGFDFTVANGLEDPDGDLHTNRQEFLANTNPNDGSSHLRILEVEREGAELHLTVATVPGTRYVVQTLQAPDVWVNIGEPFVATETTFDLTITTPENRTLCRVAVAVDP